MPMAKVVWVRDADDPLVAPGARFATRYSSIVTLYATSSLRTVNLTRSSCRTSMRLGENA